MTPQEGLATKGWCKIGRDPALRAWVDAARPVAEGILADPQARADWMRCGETWFAGVNIFPNGPDGAVGDKVPPLSGNALELALTSLDLAQIALDRAQISVCLPGYPRQGAEESAANFRFRRDRDAAHLDGLLRDDNRRRTLGEVHGFILGIPLSDTPPDAAPLVVWEGSHEVIRAAFRARFRGIDPVDWVAEDVTDFYAATRREVFETCRRVTVHARPGEAYILHRLAIHGVAPWGDKGGQIPRMIAYFRPDPCPGQPPGWWLERP